MPSFRKLRVAVGILGAVVCSVAVGAGDSEGDARSELDTFNKKFVELHLRMDTPGIMALWAEDGVDLMHGEAALVGRKTITAWIEGVLANMPGYKVTKEEMEFHDIQVAQAPEGKPNFEGYGKMALVLHREAGGGWKIKQEMWNSSPKP